jgi:hypothetical protein
MKQVKMITDTVNAFSSPNLYHSYLKLVTMIGMKLKLPGVLSEAVTSIDQEIFTQMFDIDLLKEEVNDWFTIALEKDNLVQPLTEDTVEYIKAEILTQYKGNFVTPLFIPHQGGRLMIDVFNIIGKNALYLCVEPNILQYRVALINAKIYDVPSLILNLDHRKHDVRIDSHHWEKAGRWKIGGTNE